MSNAEPIFVKEAEDILYDVIIVGAGPAGASAALYAARAGHKTLVIDRAPATGALAITKEIENYPGMNSVSGLELLEQMQRHAKQFGAIFLQSQVQGATVDDAEKYVYTPAGVFRGRALIVATGARGRKNKLPGEEQFEGRGVSYCAICDAAFTKGENVAVYGDNEEALEEALMLTRHAQQVDLYVPRGNLLGVPEDHPLPDVPNLKVYFKTPVLKVLGAEQVEGILIKTPEGKEEERKYPFVFIYVGGAAPATGFLGEEVPRDSEGYMIADETMATPIPGVFAAGDARKTPVKQAVIAAADGALAAISADRFLRGRKSLVAQH